MIQGAIDKWYETITATRQLASDEITSSLKKEIPPMLSVVFERTCNLRCAHCLYPTDHSSEFLSKQNNFTQVVPNLAQQLPKIHGATPALLHEGRILQPWHLDVLETVRQSRPDVKIGLIENGSYARLLSEFQARKFRLDWLDISLDGLKESHNRQRDPVLKRSWDQTIDGLKHARYIVKPNARLSVLMTISALNYQDIAGLADFVFSSTPADEFHVTAMVPKLPFNWGVDLNIEQWQQIWPQIVNTSQKYNADLKQKFFFKLYNISDLAKLARVVKPQNIYQALTKGDPEGFPLVDRGSITFAIDQTPVTYYPTSIWPQESFLIDADATARVAYAQQFTLQELRRNPILAKFTVCQLTPESDYQQVYEQSVHHWWQHFGQKFLEKEIATIQNFKTV